METFVGLSAWTVRRDEIDCADISNAFRPEFAVPAAPSPSTRSSGEITHREKKNVHLSVPIGWN